MNAPTTLTELRRTPTALAQVETDYKVDLFSVRGLKLATKLAEMLGEGDAIPPMFRRLTLKRGGRNQPDVWVENPGYMGNCLVAIETARALNMSVVSVMQNANIIEGKLSWSAQFWIGAINASGRFLPLRFDIQSRGRIKATYREKKGYNEQRRGFDYEEREVEVDDLVCVAWTLPFGFVMPKGIYTLKQARDAGLPLIESSPVSMKLAVEEGWYSKPGSKWQTEMKHQMLQYRAGAFFGRIHAPDIVMGMGQTSEEIRDMQTIDLNADGTVSTVTPETLRRPSAAGPTPMADVVNGGGATDEVARQAGAVADQVERTLNDMADSVAAGREPDQPAFDPEVFDSEAFAEKLEKCATLDALDVLADELRSLGDQDLAATLNDIYLRRREQLANGPAPANVPAAAGKAGPTRRTRTTQAPE